MQLLPASLSENALGLAAPDVSFFPNNTTGNESFETVYSSFIEEGREDYTGRPYGFSALEDEAGTLSREKAEILAKELKKRNAQDASLQLVEQMVAADAPLTIGKIFGTLSGTRRLDEQLSTEEADSFSQLMTKFGFSTEDTNELISMSDQGKSKALWQRISQKMDTLEAEGIHVSDKEFASLLKGLDISSAASKQMQKAFSENIMDSYSKDQLRVLLAEAGKEIASKDLAAQAVQKNMRGAMADALQTAKLNELGGSTADMRGSARSSASEQRMQLAAQKKVTEVIGQEEAEANKIGKPGTPTLDAAKATNAASTAHDATGSFKEGADNFGSGADTQSRADRILQTRFTEKAEGKNASADAMKEAVQEMMQKVGVAPSAESVQLGNNGLQQDALSLARSHRQEIFSQVEQGIMQGAVNGAKQLTLQLNPENLGQLTVVLTMQHGELKATLRADKPETATVLQEQMAELKATLEEQGIKVADIGVETRLGEDSSQRQWSSNDEHNQMQDAQERARFARLSQLRKEALSDSGISLEVPKPTASVAAGLHIIA